jgi:nicotinamidase-related amidase
MDRTEKNRRLEGWTSHTADVYREAGIGSRVGFGQRPAVLVVDLIRGCTDKESPLPAVVDIDPVVEKTCELLRVARQMGIPVVFTTLGPYRADMREVGPIAVKMPGLKVFAEHSPWSQVDPRLEMRPTEFLVWKKWQSAFFKTELQPLLTGLGVDTLIVVGCTTSGCLRATVTDGASHGLRVILPRECIGDRTREVHEANLFDLDAKNADVLTLREVLNELQRRA